MKTLLIVGTVLALTGWDAFGQADQVKRRAKEVVNQHNVRQGVPPPAPPASPRPAPGSSAASQAQSISTLQKDFAIFKPGAAVTTAQTQQLTKDVALACRGTKPSLQTVTAFVNSLVAALTDKALDAPAQERLARDVDAVLNSSALPADQFDAIIADVQAILQVADAKRRQAVTAASSLKAVGMEVRKAR